MGNFRLVLPDGRHEITLKYAGEPPQGDSCHELMIDGAKLPGLSWGCNFAFTPDSRYFAASWMAERYERRTIIVDVGRRRFLVSPAYIHDFAFRTSTLEGVGASAGLSFAFSDADPGERSSRANRRSEAVSQGGADIMAPYRGSCNGPVAEIGEGAGP